MSKFSVYVTQMIPQPAIDLLRSHFDVDVSPAGLALPRADLLKEVRGRDGVLSLLNDKMDADAFDAAGSQLKVVANFAVGFDNLDIAEATKRGIVLTNTPDVLNDATADLGWALLFAVARRVVESDKFMRGGKYIGWGPMLLLGLDITGKTLGIIGAGRIGRNFAAKSKGFGMKVLYHDVARNEAFEKETGAVFVDKSTLLAESDFVSLHTPLLPSTFHLIDEPEFKQMKSTAILINTSRGPVVNEKALVKALKERWIWGAGLDVYENEPAFEPGLAELDNVVMLPHVASATVETRAKMAVMAAENIIAVLSGKEPLTCVNPEVLKSGRLGS